MDMTHNVVGWFEIPVTDINRAARFYETVFGFTLHREKMGPIEMAFFPGVQNGMGAGGSLVLAPDIALPSAAGTMVYFTALSGDLKNELARVAAAGGKVLMEKTLITPEIGYMGVLLDTEGNRTALHSRQ